MTFIPLTDRAAVLEALEQVTAMVRQPYPVIRCGDSNPDPAVEARIVAARAETCATVDPPACGGRQIVLVHAYRCVECSRWFHRDCILAHFRAHGAPTT